MSNIELNMISAPELGSASYGTNIGTQFANIDSNFRQIVEGEYLKGQSGDIVMLEEIDLLADQSEVNLSDSALQIKNKFLGYINGFNLPSNSIGGINSQKLYMIYTKNEETRNVVYKSSLPYTFLDPRFNPITEGANTSMDKSCIIMYSEADNDFVSYNAFPNIYFNDDINEFCWKINNLETSLPARGPKGDKGDKGQVYMMRTMGLENTGDSDSKIYKLGFLNEQGSITAEMNGCLAYIYCSNDHSGHISTMRVEYIPSNQSLKATSILNASTNLYTIFSGNALKDVLTEVKPDSSFNYLFIPSKFDNGQLLEEAHVITTKRSGDIIPAPRSGFWWDGYNQSNWEALTDPNICIISPATVNNDSTRTLKGSSNNSGILYNNYKTNICPGDAYFGKIATKSIYFDNNSGNPNNRWNISNTVTSELLIDSPSSNRSTIWINGASLVIGNDLVVNDILWAEEKAIIQDLCYNKNGAPKSWMTLKKPTSVLSAAFPNSYVSKSEINEMYLSGVTFQITISIGSYSKSRTFRVDLGGAAADGYDILLDTVTQAFNEFIIERQSIEPSNSSYLWNPDPSRDGDYLLLKYEGNKTGNPDYLTIEVVTGADFELQYSYNPIKYVNPNIIKIDGNVETPGKVSASELFINGQNIYDKISSIADDENQSLLTDYFTEDDSMFGSSHEHEDGSNTYSEGATILPGYRAPIQIWKSPYYDRPGDRICEYHTTGNDNVYINAAKYRIEIDLTKATSYISHLHIQTAFKAIGAADSNRIYIELYITDVNKKSSEWRQMRNFTVGNHYIDTTITFKNNKVYVEGFTEK